MRSPIVFTWTLLSYTSPSTHIYTSLPLYLKLLVLFFWMIIRCLEFMYRRFGRLCLFHLSRCFKQEAYTTLTSPKRKNKTFRKRRKFEIRGTETCVLVPLKTRRRQSQLMRTTDWFDYYGVK